MFHDRTPFLTFPRKRGQGQGGFPLVGDHLFFPSEPLSTDPGWELIPANHVVHISPDHSVHRRALRGGPTTGSG